MDCSGESEWEGPLGDYFGDQIEDYVTWTEGVGERVGKTGEMSTDLRELGGN